MFRCRSREVSRTCWSDDLGQRPILAESSSVRHGRPGRMRITRPPTAIGQKGSFTPVATSTCGIRPSIAIWLSR